MFYLFNQELFTTTLIVQQIFKNANELTKRDICPDLIMFVELWAPNKLTIYNYHPDGRAAVSTA